MSATCGSQAGVTPETPMVTSSPLLHGNLYFRYEYRAMFVPTEELTECKQLFLLALDFTPITHSYQLPEWRMSVWGNKAQKKKLKRGKRGFIGLLE